MSRLPWFLLLGVILFPHSSATAQTSTYEVNASALNVRTGPGLDNRRVGLVPRGAQLTATGERRGEWVQVRFDGREGWVHGGYLRESNGEASTRRSESQTMIVTADTLRVRSGAGTSHPTIGQLQQGTSVQVTGSQGAWKSIQFSGGRTGWVHGNYLSANGTRTNDRGDGTTDAGSTGTGRADTNGDGRTSHSEGVDLVRSQGGTWTQSRPGGTTFNGLSPAGADIIRAAGAATRRNGVAFVVTGAAEQHSHSRGSRHYAGDAIDIRSTHMSSATRSAVVRDIQAELRRMGHTIGSGRGQYEVIVEHNPPHIHIERNRP
jgi:uncharacterized protein YraI